MEVKEGEKSEKMYFVALAPEKKEEKKKDAAAGSKSYFIIAVVIVIIIYLLSKTDGIITFRFGEDSRNEYINVDY